MRIFAVIGPFIVTLMLALPAAAEPSDAPSAASALSMQGAATIVEGSLQMISGAAELLVSSVQVAGESTRIVLIGLVDGVNVSATVAVHSAGALSVASGELLRVVATTSGHLLLGAGEILAVIPDQLGATLLYHQRLTL